MTAGTTDLPNVGHVLRYVYLFREESKRGRDEGVKERFVIVVGRKDATYLVAAVTTKGDGRANRLPLPAPVASAAGLSPNSRVVISEYNRFTWPGFDIRPLMDQPGFIAGRIRPSFLAKIIDALLTQSAAAIDRD